LPFTVQVTDGHSALGDSYSSGEGASSFDPGTGSPSDTLGPPDLSPNHCHRSSTAWAYGVDAAKGFNTRLDACSGALIEDFYGYNPDNTDEVPQLDNVSSVTTRLVTLTVGGNNMGFGDVLTSCIV